MYHLNLIQIVSKLRHKTIQPRPETSTVYPPVSGHCYFNFRVRCSQGNGYIRLILVYFIKVCQLLVLRLFILPDIWAATIKICRNSTHNKYKRSVLKKQNKNRFIISNVARELVVLSCQICVMYFQMQCRTNSYSDSLSTRFDVRCVLIVFVVCTNSVFISHAFCIYQQHTVTA